MDDTDPAIVKARELFEQSGKSLDQLGIDMGLESGTARKGAWQFLNKVKDPKLSTLRRVAKSLGVPIEELVTEPVKKRRKT